MFADIMQRASVRAARHRYVENATRVTPAPAALADTSNNGARSAPRNGESQMFANDTTETILTKIIGAAMLAAFVATLFA